MGESAPIPYEINGIALSFPDLQVKLHMAPGVSQTALWQRFSQFSYPTRRNAYDSRKKQKCSVKSNIHLIDFQGPRVHSRSDQHFSRKLKKRPSSYSMGFECSKYVQKHFPMEIICFEGKHVEPYPILELCLCSTVQTEIYIPHNTVDRKSEMSDLSLNGHSLMRHGLLSVFGDNVMKNVILIKTSATVTSEYCCLKHKHATLIHMLMCGGEAGTQG